VGFFAAEKLVLKVDFISASNFHNPKAHRKLKETGPRESNFFLGFHCSSYQLYKGALFVGMIE
jgi:hypothetical protein